MRLRPCARRRGRRIDTGSLTQEQRDEARRLALLELAATGTRSLPQQAARMDQVLARHIGLVIALIRWDGRRAIRKVLRRSPSTASADRYGVGGTDRSLTQLPWKP